MTITEPALRSDSPSIAFLRWALPQLGLRWSGFRRVRRQVWRKIGRRIAELHLSGPDAYRDYLGSHVEEWSTLDSFCRIPISRFLRDRDVFACLAAQVLPGLAEAASRRAEWRMRAWSAGCASGEEPYSLALLWQLELGCRFPGLAFEIVATDVEESLLSRAREARYRKSSLREVPAAWIDSGFAQDGEWFTLRQHFRALVDFRQADIREELPSGLFDIVLCRNLVCTYFDEPLQRRTFARIASVLHPGGALVIGRDERLPRGMEEFGGWVAELGIFRRLPALMPDSPTPGGTAQCT